MKRHRYEPFWVAAILCVLAAVAPMPLYFMMLTLFGVPHLLREMAWSKVIYQTETDSGWWSAVIAILASQVLARLGVWSSLGGPSVTFYFDMMALVLALLNALLLMLMMPPPTSWVRMVLVSVLTILLAVAAHSGTIVAILALLVIVHHFTPQLSVSDNAQVHDGTARWVPGLLFALPWGLAMAIYIIGPVDDLAGTSPLLAWQPIEVAWLGKHFASAIHGALSGLVLAQCLHYYRVIRLSSLTLADAPPEYPWRTVSVVVSAILAACYFYDCIDAHSLYAVAIAFHAWLAWPLTVVALGMARSTSRP